uniref:Thioredoxin n=1 Tax=Megaviridae environmental sample TaxID=1737588 RepID=A0A5J6VIJ0_9VIRU|nr:MAG: thioredoxin [Megaviridae environmental sample]
MDFHKNNTFIVMLFVGCILFLLVTNAECSRMCNLKRNSDTVVPRVEETPENNNLEVINFNASWCGHSKNLQPTWDELANKYKDNPNINIIDIKCEGENLENCQKAGITGFPTIVAFTGSSKHEYNGDRSFNDIDSFIQNTQN